MIKFTHSLRIALAGIVVSAVSGCQTTIAPKFDFVKSPEFSEEAANFAKDKDYPEVKDAPLLPTDLRSDKQWDRDALELQNLRNDNGLIEPESSLTNQDANSEYNRLKAKAQAYKKDDPKSGPVQGFPNYKPRR